MLRELSIGLLALATACTLQDFGSLNTGRYAPPRVDHHQHLLSPAAANLVNTHLGTSEQSLDGAGMVQLLDEAGIPRAVILSNAYYFDSPPAQQLPNYVSLMQSENDWTAAEVERFPDRLIGFCSFNPLLPHAIAELERCARNKTFKGVKLHFNLSGVDLLKSDHAEKLANVFAAADRHRLPILVHASAPTKPPYGAEHARVFVQSILPAAPDIPVIIAHLWGGAEFSEPALAVYAEAVASDLRAAKNLYFEVAQTHMTARGSEQTLNQIAHAIRQVGVDRVFYGSDGPQFGGQKPADAWREFREKVPLTAGEHERLARNVAPFLR